MGSKQSKRKGVFAIVSALWWLAKVLTALVNAVKDLAKERNLSDDIMDERVLALGKPEGSATIKQMAALILGQVEKHLIDTDAPPHLPSGWKVEDHKKGGKFLWDPTKLFLYLSPNQQGDASIKGYDLRQIFVNQPVLNANVLDYLLAHHDLIPESWNGKFVYFWGTIYYGTDNRLFVRYLYWDDRRGYGWGYDWLGRGWYRNSPAVVASV